MAKTAVAAAPAREQWTGQVGFIVAAIGSAIGLGNIWRFPGVAFENGGGAFLIPYCVALVTAGIPILLLDYALGHRFRGSPPLAYRRVAGKVGEAIGWFQVMINIFIATFYTVVVAWAASYFVFSFDLRWGDDASGFFERDYLHAVDTPATFDFVPGVLIPVVIVWVLVLLVQGSGVAKGLEKSNIIFMPILTVSFLALVIGALTLPGAIDGVNAFFTPDFAALKDPGVWIAAYGQIFFSLSIAFGIMVTYSSYRRRRANLAGPGLVVAFANSSFELLAGIGVFATLGFFASQQGVAVSELSGTGIGLAFTTFPTIVSAMPMSQLFGLLFFGSLVVAGFTSVLSVIEVVISAFMDKFLLTRKQAVWGIGSLLMVASVLLYTTTSGVIMLDTIDKWANNIGIVSASVMTAVLIIWVLRRGPELAWHISQVSTFKVGRIWQFLVGFLSPGVIIVLLVQVVIGLFKNGYNGYPTWFLLIFGWGSIAAMFVGAVVFTAARWKNDPLDFVPYPTYPGKTKGH